LKLGLKLGLVGLRERAHVLARLKEAGLHQDSSSEGFLLFVVHAFVDGLVGSSGQPIGDTFLPIPRSSFSPPCPTLLTVIHYQDTYLLPS